MFSECFFARCLTTASVLIEVTGKMRIQEDARGRISKMQRKVGGVMGKMRAWIFMPMAQFMEVRYAARDEMEGCVVKSKSYPCTESAVVSTGHGRIRSYFQG